MKLNKCPFCGSPDCDLRTVTLPCAADVQEIYVHCSICDAQGPIVLFDREYHEATDIKTLEAMATKSWNNRS